MVRSLKFELSGELDEERNRKNSRLDEVTRLINTHKGLLDEHVRQQGESLKALLKATLNEESAQRHREDDKII
jgi:prophage tail gpP-like protein